jgi:hypothetical protein
MLKGVLVAFGIMLICALIPLVHFIAFPLSPFIGGYVGINFAGAGADSYLVKGLKFGSLMGLVVLLIGGGAAAAVTLAVSPTQQVLLLVWGGVAVFTMYTASMGALGAMYSSLRAGRQQSSGAAQES